LNNNTNTNRKNVDIYIFHTGDFTTQDAAFFEQHFGFPNFIFYDLSDTQYWSLPFWLRFDRRSQWVYGGKKGYAIGYRHMIRWYAIGIFDFFQQKGYTYVMRMDDDSLLHSPINYNLFEFMIKHELNYGYRLGYRPERGSYDLRPWIKKWITHNFAENENSQNQNIYKNKKKTTILNVLFTYFL
jgi:alpha 1,2-mannosyltransferase